MKLHFEPDLDYQLQAIEAVCDLFKGQEICRTEFTVSRRPFPGAGQVGLDLGDGFGPAQSMLALAVSQVGVGNRLMLLEEEILRNLQEVQVRNGLAPAEELLSGDFTVEMETGTGKTYVYLRTIFELHKRYGFSKFVIVVPSVAIKEGVYKTLQITQDHFRGLYAGVPCDYFLYDSSKLGQVRNFATSSQIQVMVVTVGAINKKEVNNLYKPNEKMQDERPIDLIVQTRPIVIVDEPQSVDGGLKGAGKTALEAMHPLCTLRYSATHVDKHHMVYRLDAVDAYERRLVKQIEVASATVEDGHNRPYVRLLSVSSKKKCGISARVELDVEVAGSVRRQEVSVQDGDDLELTTRRAVYENCRIGEIRTAKGGELLELRVPGGEAFLRPGESWGDVDSGAVHRQMIRRTIKEHLDKEKRLRPQQIKVLSLFFIDAVDKYRRYDAEGRVEKGDYARIFEEEYRRAANHPDYRTLFEGVDLTKAAEEVHDGYFSIDRKGGWTDTAENNEGNRENAERAYNLIMKEKEKLLSLETPLKFIFSHSALREGWDNPNVFQICALREMSSELERRQTIGRGLRLCVNQSGDRVRGFEVNTLTVVARERYEEFAENLQREFVRDGLRFGVVEPHQFAGVPVHAADGSTTPLGVDASKVVWEHLKAQGQIDAQGQVQDTLRHALKEGTFGVPDAFAPQAGAIREILKKLAGRLEIKNADERRVVRARQAVLQSPEFKALWDRIKHKTTYRVAFDNERLIEQSARALREAPPIPRTRLQWRKADLVIGKAGVEATERETALPVALEESEIELPDLLTELQDRTQLTRRSLHRILVGSRRLDDFSRNPQAFISIASDAINRLKQLAVVDGIRYQRLGDSSYYAQELFEEKELAGYLRNMLEADRSVYEYVVFDSESIERPFAESLQNNSAVKVYAKLPGWFQVPTPLGSYNPDWAVLVETETGNRLYFVVETKPSLFGTDLRPREQAKIDCGEAHFAALASEVREEPAQYVVARNFEDLTAQFSSSTE